MVHAPKWDTSTPALLTLPSKWLTNRWTICVFHKQYIARIIYFVIQLVKDLHLSEYEEEVDAFFASQIADTVRKYQLENNDDSMNIPRTDHDSDNIEHFAQEHFAQEHFAQVVLLRTAG